MSDTGSSVPRRQLGRMLRQLREESGHSLGAVAKELQFSRAKMYRIENGEVPVRRVDVAAMCQLYGVSADLTEVCTALATETRAKGWWHAYGTWVPAWFDLYLGLEAAATHLRQYEPLLIPGLLQTAEYATAVIGSQPWLTPAGVGQAVALRMERQRLLARRRPAAPNLDVIIAEGVLRRPLDNGTMARQIQHLMSVADIAPVGVRVLPAAREPHYATGIAPFVILDFEARQGRTAEPSTVYSEGLTGALYLDQPGEVEAFGRAWKALDELALDDTSSRSLMESITEEISDGSAQRQVA